MTEQRHVYAVRGTAPLWLVLAAIAPLGIAFLTSLVLAVALAGAGATLAAIFLPLLGKRPHPTASDTIELDSSDYKHVDDAPPEERR